MMASSVAMDLLHGAMHTALHHHTHIMVSKMARKVCIFFNIVNFIMVYNSAATNTALLQIKRPPKGWVAMRIFFSGCY